MEEKNVNTEAVSEETKETVSEKETSAESAETKELKEKLEKTEKDLAAANDKYLRMIAEYDN